MSARDVLNALADRREIEGASYALDAQIECLCDPDRKKVLGIARAYTTSMDAAVALMPPGDDVFYRSGHDGTGPDPALFKAEVLVCRITKPAHGFVARARTEAMARCAAALRARAALEPA